MRESGGNLVLSATDLSNFLNCRHRTALEIGEVRGKHKRPAWHDPLLEALFKRGLEHERRYVDSLQSSGRQVVELGELKGRDEAATATLVAMRDGSDVIVQAALRDGHWYGRPDVLLKVERASGLGAWSYEVADTKLARETRAGTILQLGLYCAMLDRAQGLSPEHFHIVTPETANPIHTYRVGDYDAYFRLIRARLEATSTQDDTMVAAANYPEPVEHCDVCPWSGVCNRKRHADDHLSLVAGITRLQRRELEARDIATVTGLAKVPLPLPFKPSRGAADSYVRAREQARVQVEAREKAGQVFECIEPIEAGKGLACLPKPAGGDIFLDLEGDPFAVEGGREYLFGLVSLEDGRPLYRAFWASNAAEERVAFETVVDIIMQSAAADPSMHVYHFAPYEPAALKRLMGRYAARESEMDTFLRAEQFVDLYGVVRQGIRAGIERYSLKDLERFYAFARQVPLLDANRCLRQVEQALELGRFDVLTPEVRGSVEGYNRDDCLSTLGLRDWLESVRAEALQQGLEIPRPEAKAGEPSAKVDERAQRVDALRVTLLTNVPSEQAERSAQQQSRWLLAYLLDWHRREEKSGWWDYFRLRDLPKEDLLEEGGAVAGLEFAERVDVVLNKKTQKPTGSVIDRYRYPVQEMEIRRGDTLKLKTEDKFGDVEAVDRRQQTLDVRKGPKMADNHPDSAFVHNYINASVIEDAVYSIGAAVAAGAPDALAQRLLMADPPRLRTGEFLAAAQESSVEFAVRITGDLDETVLAIQGPPGAGKTFTGAEMICALVGQGRKIGVIATSHKVIRKLLDDVAAAATRKRQTGVKIGHKVEEAGAAGTVIDVTSNQEAHDLLASGEINVLGGTAWLWARPEFAKSVSVLFADEAGQMSLVNVLAATQAAGSIVLLGDPQQLEQPTKGSHPEGVGLSALQHLLGEHLTMLSTQGVFLPETWRLSPEICRFTSEVFYEGRLASKPGLERQRLVGGPLDGSGLWTVEVDHDGNRNASDEEVEIIADLVARLTALGSQWIDERGTSAQMTGADILVVAPFNAHVVRLDERLAPTGVRVGTVDRFQGQQAPVVIYSMATSRPEDAPRGMEFLYCLNRLNVATSRAQCAAVIVASPRLFVPDCTSPRQMKLANALCRYRELARIA